MPESLDAVVVGAGVVGLAIARSLARAGRECVVLESEDAIGTATSSRNSEVIHAGIAYAAGSLKATLCRRGRDRLYEYAAEHRIPHARCGKIVVATAESEVDDLREIERKAAASGVDDLVRLTIAEAKALEPEIAGQAALLSPSTGIIDSHSLMRALEVEIGSHGGTVLLRSPVVGGRAGANGIEIDVGGAEPFTVRANSLVIAAGLGAQKLAREIAGIPSAAIPPLHYAKGSYFVLRTPPPFSRLVYPVPGPASLGIHFTRDLSGRGRFGPDLEWVDRIDYRVDESREAGFARAIRRYWPALPDGALEPGYSGVRPKIQAKGAPAADFVIAGAETHGVAGLVALFGIESPGLTSALAIAEVVERKLTDGR